MPRILCTNLQSCKVSLNWSLVSLDAIGGLVAVHPEGDVAEDLARQELVEGLGQLLRVVDPSQAEVLSSRSRHLLKEQSGSKLNARILLGSHFFSADASVLFASKICCWCDNQSRLSQSERANFPHPSLQFPLSPSLNVLSILLLKALRLQLQGA